MCIFYLYENFYVGRQALLPSTEILGMGKPSASLERVQGYHMSNIKTEKFVVTLLSLKVILLVVLNISLG